MQQIAEPSLKQFFSYLRGEGFPGGPGECVRALRIYNASPPAQRGNRLKTLLAPVFARSAAEQVRFYDAFDAYFDEPEAASAPAFSRDTEDGPAVHTPTIAAPRPQVAATGPRLRARFWLGVAVAWTLVFAVVFWMDLPRRLFPPRGIPDTGAASASARKSRMATGTRPCSGFECVVSGPRPWIISAPIALWVLILLIASSDWMRTVRSRRRERASRAPFDFRLPLRLPPPPPSIQNETGAAAAALAAPMAARSQWLDIPSTIYETTRAAGFPTPRFRQGRESEMYVVAVEERSAADHLAAWFTELAHALAARNVEMALYRFRGTAQFCYRSGTDVALPLERLLAANPGAALLLFGSTRAITDPFTARVARWASGLLRRGRTVLLTPAAPWEWGPPDRELSASIPMLPARVASLPLAVRLLSSPEAKAEPIRGIADEMPMPPAELFAEAASAENLDPALRLRGYMDDAVFRWLCACALYPKLQWELTCRMGVVVDHTRKLLEEPCLLALIRLPWFRAGEIPVGWRAALIACLDEATSQAAQRALLEWLERVPLPAGSVASATHRLHLAAARFRLHPQDVRARADLIAVLKGVSRNDVESDPLIRATVRQLQQATARDRISRRVAVWYRQMPRSELASGVVLFLCASAVLTWNIGVPVEYMRMVPDVERPTESPTAAAPPTTTHSREKTESALAGRLAREKEAKLADLRRAAESAALAKTKGTKPAARTATPGNVPGDRVTATRPTGAANENKQPDNGGQQYRPPDVDINAPPSDAINQAVRPPSVAPPYRNPQSPAQNPAPNAAPETRQLKEAVVSYICVAIGPKEERSSLENRLRAMGFPVATESDPFSKGARQCVTVGPIERASDGQILNALTKAGFKVLSTASALRPQSAK